MKTTKWMNKGTSMLAATLLLLAVSSGAADVFVGYSSEVDLDTRTMSRVAAEEDKPVDSRSYTIEWSIAGTLNTKRIIGSIILVR